MGQWYCLWLWKTISFYAFIYSFNKHLLTMYRKVIKNHYYMQESIAHTIFIVTILSKKSERTFLILSVLYYTFLLIWSHATFPVSFFSHCSKDWWSKHIKLFSISQFFLKYVCLILIFVHVFSLIPSKTQFVHSSRLYSNFLSSVSSIYSLIT